MSSNSKVILVIPAGLLVLSLGALVTAVWQFESISALLEQTHWTLGFTQSMDPIQAAPGWEEPEPAADGLNSAEKNPEHCTVFYASNCTLAALKSKTPMLTISVNVAMDSPQIKTI